jgi:HEPN domain-containing protein
MADAREAAQALLARAADDEHAARALVTAEQVSDAIVGFLAQQAAEKSLKAVLVARGVTYRFTHDLAYLAELCEGEGLALPDELSEIDRLSAFAVRLRYDAAPASPVEPEQAIAWAEIAVRWAGQTIGELGSE